MLFSAVAAAVLALATPQSAPIVHPGAPGAPSRIITAQEAVNLSRSTHTADDVRFMQHMIVHHAQAVEMVGLLEHQGSSERVKLLGRRIALGQEAEMALMRDWLAARGEPEAMPGMDHATMNHAAMGHDMAGMSMTAEAPSETPLMPGMLSPAQMARLAAAQGEAFDRLFLEGMIQHHHGALEMVNELMALPDAGEDAMLSEFLTSVVADQSAEILRMQTVLSELPQT